MKDTLDHKKITRDWMIERAVKQNPNLSLKDAIKQVDKHLDFCKTAKHVDLTDDGREGYVLTQIELINERNDWRE